MPANNPVSSLTPSALPQLGEKPVPKSTDVQALRDQLRALFDQPDLLPDKFLGFLVDYLSINQPAIPISQIFGFTGFTPNYAAASGTVSTSSTSFVSLSGGPTLLGLANGNYLLIYGAQMKATTGGTNCLAVPAVNANSLGTAPAMTGAVTAQYNSGTGATTAALTGGVNTVELQYATSVGTSAANFQGRWIIAIRFSNL